MYQDYVIKGKELVGKFDELYSDFEDPWNQSREDHVYDTRRNIAIDWCRKLRDSDEFLGNNTRVLEIGCGFGHITDRLRKIGFASIGIDKSIEAIKKARILHPISIYASKDVEDFCILDDYDPDIIIFAEVTWYILPQLEDFLNRLRSFSKQRSQPVYFVHLLTTYAEGKQKYGLDFFSNIEQILNYFNLKYIESGVIKRTRIDDMDSQGTYFVARVD